MIADLEDPLEALRKVMLVHGTAWQPAADICVAYVQVLALGIASTRLRYWYPHGLASDASAASRTAATSQYKLFLQLPWSICFQHSAVTADPHVAMRIARDLMRPLQPSGSLQGLSYCSSN